MSFTERAGFIPVLLLTGCASPSVVTGPPSGSVVDSYLSRSAADISAMQYRIHQSGPSALRPVSLSSSIHGSGLLSKPPTLGSDSGSMPFKPAISVGSTVGTGGFIRLGGAAPTLRAALRNIVPSDHTVTFEKSIKPDTPEFWTWVGNDRWPYVINKMLSEHKLKAEINEKLKTVSVTPLQVSESGTVTPQSVPVPPSNINLNKPAGAAATSDSAGISKGRNPFRGENTTTATVSVKAALPHPLTPIPIAKPITVKHWRIEAGNTLRDWLSSQAAAEPCASPGIPHWTLAWVTPTNYRVDAPLNFEGNFREMLDRLFTLYGTAKVPLYAGVRSSQCVISVDDKEVR